MITDFQLNLDEEKEPNYLPVLNTHFTLFGGHQEEVLPGWQWKTEAHPAFELIYILSGQQKTVTETQEMIVHAGEFILIPIGEYHTNSVYGDEPCSYFSMHFNMDDLSIKYLLSESYGHRIIGPQWQQYPRVMKQLKMIVSMIKPEYGLADRLNLQMAVIHLILILVKATQDETNYIGKLKELDHYMLAQQLSVAIKEKVDRETYHQKTEQVISISEIINQFHISQSQALKLFKKFFQKTPQAYLIELKMTQAKQLLLQPNMSIRAVSEKLGYSSPSHFSREFNKQFQLSPRDYVKKCN
ncbi:AraC family transcriptional regulator [Weissella diestrammenae]|uniref:AraC family transcriptional regulator n=1 Tax=Weissella diestrammenae TaxID=1162633 RepID=A0A7G9T3L9_9LACO|nr:helix-turn-helix domain-containing protein [Weissella diestrammenae]MCM0582670.1 AraC family transcriptional regulator [Weissella diestrammenae]QNN74694.1 AraC family transcriptional regulator [Weissella diestrammenae]